MVVDRLAVAAEEEAALGQFAGLRHRVEVGDQRAGAPGGAVEGTADQRVRGDVGEEVVADEAELALGVPEDGVHGAVAGPEQDFEPAVAQARRTSPSASGRVTLTARAPAAIGAGDAPQGERDVLGDAAAEHQFDRELVVELGFGVVVGEPLARRCRAPPTSAPECSTTISPAPGGRVWLWVTRIRLDVLDRVAVRGERLAEHVERRCRSSARRRSGSAGRPRSGRR